MILSEGEEDGPADDRLGGRDRGNFDGPLGLANRDRGKRHRNVSSEFVGLQLSA
jgi:hypothetical protein